MKVTDDNRTLRAVPAPPDDEHTARAGQHPARLSDEDGVFPVPGIPPISITEAGGHCPHCGGSLVIVLEAQ
jgi:hypothetical protein